MHVIRRFQRRSQYPPQVQLLFWGTLVSMTGQSFVWPFLTVYIHQQLAVPLTQVAFLFTLQSLSTLAATGFFGPLMDRLGRKWAMVGGMAASGLTLLTMTAADTLSLWAVILMGYAALGAVFRIGANAMIADLVEPQERTGAYALIRMANNIGIVVGPAVGGFLVAASYELSFLIAAVVQIGVAIYAAFVLRETLDRSGQEVPAPHSGGYGPLLHDRAFLSVWGVYLLTQIATSMVFSLLAVYIKTNYGVTEDYFGFILGTNAALVVLFQYSVTRRTKRHAPLRMMALASAFYAAGMLAYALGTGFLAFWLGMVIMTVGELVLEPTAITFVANLAPPDMRARYMGIYGLSYRVGSGVGPLLGGYLSDTIAPPATWYGAAVFCGLAMVGFWAMRQRRAALAARAPSAGD